jgi:hypothetical protein
VSEDPLAEAIVKLHADDATKTQVRIVLRNMVHNPSFRQRCASLGALVRDSEEGQRRLMALSMATVLLHEVTPPPNPTSGDRFLAPGARHTIYGGWYGYGGRWAEGEWAAEGHVQPVEGSLKLSKELIDALGALEEFWGCPEWLLD